MGNVWGVSNPIARPHGLNASQTTLVAGSETTFGTQTGLVASSPGAYGCMCLYTLCIQFGASAPTALAFHFQLNSGSNADTFTVNPNLLVGSTFLQIAFHLFSTASDTIWYPSAPSITFSGLATTNNCTVLSPGSRIDAFIYRDDNQ
jgi:hypothetical protein